VQHGKQKGTKKSLTFFKKEALY